MLLPCDECDRNRRRAAAGVPANGIPPPGHPARAGLVKVRREGKQVYYTLNQDRLASACCVLTDNFAPEHKLVMILADPQV